MTIRYLLQCIYKQLHIENLTLTYHLLQEKGSKTCAYKSLDDKLNISMKELLTMQEEIMSAVKLRSE
jgi:hypothetical protein